MVSESASVPEPDASMETTAEVSESAEPTTTSTGVTVENEDPRWAQIEALLPEGSEDWTDVQWEAFEESEAGQELNRLIDEVLGEEVGWGDEFELSDDELTFWDSITELLPEESLEWSEAQWEDYFHTDQGLELITLLLPFIAENIESNEDAADFQALKEVFAHDPELRAYYLDMFFGIGSESGEVTPE